MDKPIFVADEFRMAFSKHGVVFSQRIMVQLSCGNTLSYPYSQSSSWLMSFSQALLHQLPPVAGHKN